MKAVLIAEYKPILSDIKMTPLVSIIMGSTSDMPVMKKAADFLNDLEIPFELLALSAHRTPAEVETFAREAKDRGLKEIGRAHV